MYMELSDLSILIMSNLHRIISHWQQSKYYCICNWSVCGKEKSNEMGVGRVEVLFFLESRVFHNYLYFFNEELGEISVLICVATYNRHEIWQTHFWNLKMHFLMQIAYIFCYTLAYLPYLYNAWVPIEKNPPGDQEFNLKLCRSNVVSVNARRNAIFCIRRKVQLHNWEFNLFLFWQNIYNRKISLIFCY